MHQDQASDDVEIVARCLCKTHTFTASVPRSSLPLKATYCHCTSCRHVTGGMYSSDAQWPGDSNEIRQASLHRYVFTKLITILFCGTCSSPMFFEMRESLDAPLGYGVFTGVLTNIDVPDLVQIAHHMFLGDTIDGGASPWLRTTNKDGSTPRLWRGQRERSEELSSNWPAVDSLPEATTKLDLDEIPIRCRCKGVDLVLRRPDRELAGRPRSETPWFVDPATNKLLGSFEACDSCRQAAGVDIFHWTFSLLRHIAFAQGDGKDRAQAQAGFPESSTDLQSAVAAGEDRDPRWGTLVCYESSPNVHRYSCGRCSACVFFAKDSRPEMVDVALGLLESPDGARAEGFISWNLGGQMAWRNDTSGGWREDLVKAVEVSAERWRLERRHPKNWLRGTE